MSLKFGRKCQNPIKSEFSWKDKIWCRKPISPLSRFDQAIIFHPTSPFLLRFGFILINYLEFLIWYVRAQIYFDK